ncbi:MAG TPA: hypothetical protein VHQ22_12875 [Terriglobales bacterium]|nr:hypothetical protein [Terriglobales bacterium]
MAPQFSFCITELMTLDSHMSAPSGIVYSTNPRKAEAVNGKTYVVKGPELDTVFAELAGCMLAAAVGIPVPPVAVCVANDEKLAGSENVEQSFRDASVPLRRPAKVVNLVDLYNVIVVDCWLGNTDRNLGNVLASSVSDGGVELGYLGGRQHRGYSSAKSEHSKTSGGSMAIDMKYKRSYRLVYFQPNPEDGERICVAIVAEEDGNHSLLYDASFPKLACIAPTREKIMLKLYLDELEHLLQSASDESEGAILRRFGPQIIFSERRVLLSSLTEVVKKRLLERFILTQQKNRLMIADEAAASRTGQHAIDESIVGFIRDFLPNHNFQLALNAKPKQIVGRSLPNAASVAASVRLPGRILLFDGVDLKLATPKQVISRVSKVSHTFWEYGRAQRESLLGSDALQKIALVLNGKPKYSTAEKDAHDFALHQFNNEADFVVTDRVRNEDIRGMLHL